MSFALKITSRARPLPMRRVSCAIGPPPGTRPAPTSNCDRMAFSRLAKRMSQARASSLPIPVARPRIDAIDTTGARLRRTSVSGHGCNLWVQEEDAPNRQVLQENPNESERNLQRHYQKPPP